MRWPSAITRGRSGGRSMRTGCRTPAPPLRKRLPGLVHKPGHRQRLSGDRQRARLDAPGVEEVVDEPAHLMGLLVDAEELVHLRRVQPRGGGAAGGGRADDGCQRRQQLVPDHRQELGEVLQGDDDRLDAAVLGPDRRSVDEGPDAGGRRGTESSISSARTVSTLLNCCARGNSARETSRPSARRHVTTPSSASMELPGGRRLPTMRLASRLNDTGRPGVEDHGADRGCLDQGLQVGPVSLLLPLRPGGGDRPMPRSHGDRRRPHQHDGPRRTPALSENGESRRPPRFPTPQRARLCPEVAEPEPGLDLSAMPLQQRGSVVGSIAGGLLAAPGTTPGTAAASICATLIL